LSTLHNKKINFKENDCETFEVKSAKLFDHQIWSSFEIGHLVQKDLSNKQLKEFNKLNQYSENIISESFKTIAVTSSLKHISKTCSGYAIYRLSTENKWIVKININDTKLEINRSS
jgi:hypothetical protein